MNREMMLKKLAMVETDMELGYNMDWVVSNVPIDQVFSKRKERASWLVSYLRHLSILQEHDINELTSYYNEVF